MKKRKNICLMICMLMIVTALPVVGVPIDFGETQTENAMPHAHTPPAPGDALNPPEDIQMEVPLIREPRGITAATIDDVVISMITQVDTSMYLRYLENITGFGPRYTGTSSCIAAAQYIYDQFQSMGLWVRYHPWTYGGLSSNNVEATINGTDTSSDEIYIVCGHYDTVSSSPGADDDGSGTTAVLIAAYIMSQYQFNNTIKFVTFSGEEQGLYGSRIYAQQAAAQGWNIAGVLNADMISYAITTTHGNNLDVYVNSASLWLYTYTVNINNVYQDYIHLTLHNAGTSSGSDHYYFWQYGYSAVFYFEYEMTPYYHSPGDTIEHINATYAVKNVRLILATLAELAEASPLSTPPEKPTLTGPTSGVINEVYSFIAVTTEPDGEDVYYYFDWDDGTNSGWLGPYSPGQQVPAEKSWSQEGTYSVQVKAKDIHQVTSQWSDPLIVTILVDRPPSTPSISGPSQGKPGVLYKYTFTTTDPDGDMVYYYIDWGDGQVSEWVGPYASGEIAIVNHQWDEKGTYIIQAKAKDIYDAESDWGTLEVAIPVDVMLSQMPFLSRLISQVRLFFESLGFQFFPLR